MTAADVEARPIFCARHPKVETVIRCGRCNTPICPRCRVDSPVGLRCPDCAGVKRVNLGGSPSVVATAVAYGFGAAFVGAVVVTLVPFLSLLGTAAAGYFSGEAFSRGARRRGGKQLAWLAVATFVAGYLLGPSVLLLQQGLQALVLYPFFMLGVLNSPLYLLALALGAFLAWNRVR